MVVYAAIFFQKLVGFLTKLQLFVALLFLIKLISFFFFFFLKKSNQSDTYGCYTDPEESFLGSLP
jgi:hypothetical protein